MNQRHAPDNDLSAIEQASLQASLDLLYAEALGQETEEARAAGAVGYMAQTLARATLPHARTRAYSHERANGHLRVLVSSDPRYGLPYGPKPRLILAWLTTRAVETKERWIGLGATFGDYLANIGIDHMTGGQRGTIRVVRDQSIRLFTASIRIVYDDKKAFSQRKCDITDDVSLWWDPDNPNQLGLGQSAVKLSENFFEEVTAAPIPISLKAMHALRGSSMAMDIYCWLTHRFSYLRRPTSIPWIYLQKQFGAGYPDTTQGLRDFRNKGFVPNLKHVLQVFPQARVDHDAEYLRLYPSRTHVRPVRGRNDK